MSTRDSGQGYAKVGICMDAAVMMEEFLQIGKEGVDRLVLPN